MEDPFVVLFTLDGRDQFNRILEGESAAKAAAKRYAEDILTLLEKGDQGCWEVFTSKVIDRRSFAYGGPNLLLKAPIGGRMLVGSDGHRVNRAGVCSFMPGGTLWIKAPGSPRRCAFMQKFKSPFPGTSSYTRRRSGPSW